MAPLTAAIPSPQQAAPDAGVASNDQRQALADLIRAARTDLHEPVVVTDDDDPNQRLLFSNLARYFGLPALRLKAANVPEMVTEALAREGSPAARDTLRAWAVNRAAKQGRRALALRALESEHRSRWGASPSFTAAEVPTLTALIDDDGWPEQTDFVSTPPLLAKVVARSWLLCGFHCGLLSALKDVGSPDALAVIRRVATDTSRTDPSPHALAAFRCPAKMRLDESLAHALASDRWVALVLLADVELIRNTASDPKGPTFFRAWLDRVVNQRTYLAPLRRDVVHDDPPDPHASPPCR